MVEPATVCQPGCYYGIHDASNGDYAWAYLTGGTGSIAAAGWCEVDSGFKQFWIFGYYEPFPYVSETALCQYIAYATYAYES